MAFLLDIQLLHDFDFLRDFQRLLLSLGGMGHSGKPVGQRKHQTSRGGECNGLSCVLLGKKFEIAAAVWFVVHRA